MAAILRILAILIACVIIYLIVHHTLKVHKAERAKLDKIKSFIIGLPSECYLLVSKFKGSAFYDRGYYFNDKNAEYNTTSIRFFGQHMNPEHPEVKINESSDGGTYMKLEFIRIPSEWVLNDLVKVKYVDDDSVNNEDEKQDTTKNKKQKGHR